ncbi:hypothetical protein MNBD_GAMMA24-2555 [hydrothermal vent metagenome]|uniref:Uncharacterized protein n=1 Tax=hydrothermal vent metagenome TaxID=652676 RepID=A0A3B1BMV1_9ZZZZ
MQFEISENEKKQARHPHEIFLINLITNHILVFIALLGMARTYPLLMLITPSISLCLLLYILFRARRSLTRDPWFVKCHWQIGARRSRLFIAMLATMGLIMLAIVLISGGELKPHHYAFAGVGALPTILTTLALIIMESEAMHQARLGIVPDRIIQQFPNPDAIRVEE